MIVMLPANTKDQSITARRIRSMVGDQHALVRIAEGEDRAEALPRISEGEGRARGRAETLPLRSAHEVVRDP